MNGMKRVKKIIDIFVYMLMLSMIPPTVGLAEEKPESIEVFNQIFISGMFFRLNCVGDLHH